MELQIETQVRAGGVALVDFDGQKIAAIQEKCRVQCERRCGVFISGPGVGVKPGVVRQSGGGFVHQLSVEINPCLVVVLEGEGGGHNSRHPGERKCASEIGGGVSGIGRAALDGGGFIPVAVAKFAVAQGPCRIIKPRGAPCAALIHARVQIAPLGPEGHRGLGGSGRGRRGDCAGADAASDGPGVAPVRHPVHGGGREDGQGCSGCHPATGRGELGGVGLGEKPELGFAQLGQNDVVPGRNKGVEDPVFGVQPVTAIQRGFGF